MKVGEEDTPIGAMPGCFRLGWRHGLLEEVYKSRDVGVNNFVLFPKVPDGLKTQTGDEAYNDNGLVPRTIRLLKDKYPDIVIYTDVALDPYSSDGHDGIVREDGQNLFLADLLPESIALVISSEVYSGYAKNLIISMQCSWLNTAIAVLSYLLKKLHYQVLFRPVT
ncbi:hypothetical protein ZWY2020_012298 [Hordeum vulgare]|nr:hypothetical protein ZWY2020_012298 [Hordeum vulgare]